MTVKQSASSVSQKPLLRVGLSFFIFLFFFFVVLIAAFGPIRTFDPWWHLATGRWIFQHHAIPRVDPFSFTRAGTPWIDLAWLFQVIEYGIYKVGGFYGLVLFKVLVALLIFFFLYKLLSLFVHEYCFTFGLLFLALGVTQVRFMVRPHLLAFLWLVLFMYLFHLFLVRGRIWQIIALVVVYILWVNTHGSFVVGPFLIGAFLAGVLAERWNWQVKDIFKDLTVKRIGLVLALLVLSTLCNPYGFKYVIFALLSHRGMGAQATKYIAEWHRMNPYNLFVLNPFSRVGLLCFLFWVTFVLLCVNIFKGRLGVVAHVLVFALALYLSLKYVRFAALASLILVPTIACLYSWFREDFPGGFRRVFSLLIFVFPLIFLVFRLLPARINNPELGRAVSRNYPHGVVKFVKEKGLRGNMFNKYGYGGFLIWNLYPQCRVFIDGRTPTVYPADFYWLYRMVYKDEKLFEELADEYNINMVIEKTGSTIPKYLDKNKSWKLVFFDEVTVLFVNDKLMKEKKLKLIRYYRPWTDIEKLIEKYHDNKHVLNKIKEEIKRVISVYEVNLKAETDLGILLSEGLKDYKSSMVVLEKAISLDPRSPNVWYNLGLVYKKMGEMSKAKSCFEKAISFDKDFDSALYQLGMIDYKAGEFRKAWSLLTRYLSIVGDRTPPEVYEKIGLSCFKLLRIEEAIRNLKKACYLTHDPKKKSRINVNLGNCYFAIGNFKIAEKHYSEAVKLDAKNRDAYYNLSKVYEKLGRKEEALKYWKLYEKLKQD